MSKTLVTVDYLDLPEELVLLIETKRWSTTSGQVHAQEFKSPIKPEKITEFLPGEHYLVLFAPPFKTAAEDIQQNPTFWKTPEIKLSEVDPERLVLIGDFGWGSDTPLALDYRHTPATVIRLQFGKGWTTVSPTFASFWQSLGLEDKPWKRLKHYAHNK